MAKKETRNLSNAGERLSNIISGAPNGTVLSQTHGNRVSFASAFFTVELDNGTKVVNALCASAYLSNDRDDLSDHYRVETISLTADDLRAMLAAIES